MEEQNQDRPLHKIGDDISEALEKCVDALSLTEFSRLTGVRIELLRRFVNKQARIARTETWDKVYPALKPLLSGPEPGIAHPPRIGPAYRRHNELVGMFSDQKVLLDEFAVLSPDQKKKTLADFVNALPEKPEPSSYLSLSVDENRLMGAFLAMNAELQEKMLAGLTRRATAAARAKRRELF